MRLALALAAALALPVPGRACDLAVDLAFDLSGSIDAAERTLILHGIAEALRHPWVAGAFSSQDARLRVTVFADRAQPLTGWVPIQSTDDLYTLAQMLDGVNPAALSVGYSTRIQTAIDLGVAGLAEVQCTREILDVMTDGEDGTPTPLNVSAFEDWQTVNVLLLAGGGPGGVMRAGQMQHGVGSFTMPLADLFDLTDGLARKMLQEVS